MALEEASHGGRAEVDDGVVAAAVLSDDQAEALERLGGELNLDRVALAADLEDGVGDVGAALVMPQHLAFGNPAPIGFACRKQKPHVHDRAAVNHSDRSRGLGGQAGASRGAGGRKPGPAPLADDGLTALEPAHAAQSVNQALRVL